MPTNRKLSLLLVEDNRLLRDGLAAMLGELPDLAVVAAVADGKTALQRAHDLRPDVALLQLTLGDHDGLQLVEALKQAAPNVRVVVLDLLPAQNDILALLQAGASGFVLREATLDDLVMTVRAVAQGEHVLPRPLADSLISEIVRQAAPPHAGRVPGGMRLTHREREVMALVCDGLSNSEIAQRLHIATYTVKSHVHSILEKLALRSRFQLAPYVRRQQSVAGAG